MNADGHFCISGVQAGSPADAAGCTLHVKRAVKQ
eukprot:gene12408-biopygen4514